MLRREPGPTSNDFHKEYQGCYLESLTRIKDLIFLKVTGRTTRVGKLKNQMANIVDGVVKRCQLEDRVDCATLTEDLYLDLLRNSIIEERGSLVEWNDPLIKMCFVDRTHSFSSKFDRQAAGSSK